MVGGVTQVKYHHTVRLLGGILHRRDLSLGSGPTVGFLWQGLRSSVKHKSVIRDYLETCCQKGAKGRVEHCIAVTAVQRPLSLSPMLVVWQKLKCTSEITVISMNYQNVKNQVDFFSIISNTDVMIKCYIFLKCSFDP